jgi:hypothetical protein
MARAAEAAGEELEDRYSHQLEYLSMRTCSLKEAMGWKHVLGVLTSRKEVALGLKSFKADLGCATGVSIMKGCSSGNVGVGAEKACH